MLVSEKALKWAMRFYPPFLFQGIWTQKIEKEFKGVEVKICKNIFNRNYNNSIFGGTIFSAADPFHVILFHQILKRRGYEIQLWSKHATIDYIKPGHGNLYLKINISDENIQEALHSIDTEGKFIKTFPVNITSKNGILCAIVHIEIYIRKTNSRT